MHDEQRGQVGRCVEWRGRRRRNRAAANNVNRQTRGKRSDIVAPLTTRDQNQQQQFVKGKDEESVGSVNVITPQNRVKVNQYCSKNRVENRSLGKDERRWNKGFDEPKEELRLYSNDAVVNSRTRKQQQQRASVGIEPKMKTDNSGGKFNNAMKGSYPTLNFHQHYSNTQLVFIQERVQLQYLRRELVQESGAQNSNNHLLGVSCLWPLSVSCNEAKVSLPWLPSSARLLEVPMVLQFSTESTAFVLDILKLSEDKNAMKELGRVMKEVMTCGNLIKLVFDPQRTIDAFASTWGEYIGWEQPWWEVGNATH